MEKVSAAAVSVRLIELGALSTGVSFAPVIFTVNVFEPLRLPSDAVTVKLSLVFELRALIAVALGT